MRLSGEIEGDHPRITIRIEGDAASLGDDLDGIIDTGFAGFVLMDSETALQLGLVPIGTTDVTLADGSTQELSTAKCRMIIGDVKIEGDAYIMPRALAILYGMALLKEARLTLTVDAANGAWLMTDETPS